MVTMVTKQKIFDKLYLYEKFKDEPIYTSQKFHVPMSRELLWDNSGVPSPWYPMWFQNPLYPKG